MFNREYKETNVGIMTTTDFSSKTMKSFLKYLYTDSIDQVEIDCDLLRAAHQETHQRMCPRIEYEEQWWKR